MSAVRPGIRDRALLGAAYTERTMPTLMKTSYGIRVVDMTDQQMERFEKFMMTPVVVRRQKTNLA